MSHGLDAHHAESAASSRTVNLERRIGGAFRLVDDTGAPVTNVSYRGKYLLVFFGYAQCTDLCSVTLAQVGAALNILGAETARIQALFVSLDSQRDTPAVLRKYVRQFHPSIVGLTGTKEEIAAIARKYRVSYAKVQRNDGGYDYSLDHSSFVYLMNPDGRYLAHFAGDSPRVMASKIAGMIKGNDSR